MINRLLNGVAITAVLALATPALAQTMTSPLTGPSAPPPASPPPPAPMSPPPATAPAPSAAAPAPAAPAPAPARRMAKKPVHRQATEHRAEHRRVAKAPPEANRLTQQLNQEELQRVQGAGGPPPSMAPSESMPPSSGPMAPPPSETPMGGPRPSPSR